MVGSVCFFPVVIWWEGKAVEVYQKGLIVGYEGEWNYKVRWQNFNGQTEFRVFEDSKLYIYA